MLELLSDGKAHTRAELHGLLWDDQGALSNIQVHLSQLRKVVRPQGGEIICEIANRRICYRHVLLLREGGAGQ
jgi:hypothetical protein